MARPPRLEFPGALYHVTARGNDRGAVFRDDEDREEYLDRIDRYRTRFGCQLLAYCLMTNHVHLAVRMGEEPLSRFMAGVQSSFAHWFNRRHGRVGHFFQGRYKASLVQEQRYFAAMIRYIHRNPVRARMVEHPRDYRWSSDRFFRGGRAPSYLDRDAALSLLGPTRRTAIRAYIQLVDGTHSSEYEEAKGIGEIVKGDEEFVMHAMERSEKFTPVLRGVSEHRILAVVADVTGISVEALRGQARGGPIAHARCLAGYVGKRLGGLPLARMARLLGREESYLLKPVAALERRLATDQVTQAAADEIVKRLRSSKSAFLD